MNGFVPKTALDVLILVVAAAIGLPIVGFIFLLVCGLAASAFLAIREKLRPPRKEMRRQPPIAK